MSEKVKQVAHAIEQAMVNYSPDKAQCSRHMSEVIARAAIEAMREPTVAMVHACETIMVTGRFKDTDPNRPPVLAWRAMIDEALKD